MNKFNTPLWVRRKEEIKACRIQEIKEARKRRQKEADAEVRRKAEIEFMKDPLKQIKDTVQNLTNAFTNLGKEVYTALKPVIKWYCKAFGYDVDELKRIEKEFKEYQKNLKHTKYQSYIPKELLKRTIALNQRKENVKGIAEKFLLGTSFGGMYNPFLHHAPVNISHCNGSVGGPINIPIDITPDIDPFFPGPKVAVGAMTGKPSEWYTKTITDIIQDEENQKKNVAYFNNRGKK